MTYDTEPGLLFCLRVEIPIAARVSVCLWPLSLLIRYQMTATKECPAQRRKIIQINCHSSQVSWLVPVRPRELLITSPDHLSSHLILCIFRSIHLSSSIIHHSICQIIELPFFIAQRHADRDLDRPQRWPSGIDFFNAFGWFCRQIV